MPQELHTKQSHDSHMPLMHGFSINVRHRKTQRRKQVSFAQPQDSKDYKKTETGSWRDYQNKTRISIYSKTHYDDMYQQSWKTGD